MSHWQAESKVTAAIVGGVIGGTIGYIKTGTLEGTAKYALAGAASGVLVSAVAGYAASFASPIGAPFVAAAAGGLTGAFVASNLSTQITEGRNATGTEKLFYGVAGAIGGATSVGIGQSGAGSSAAHAVNESNRSITTSIAPSPKPEPSGYWNPSGI